MGLIKSYDDGKGHVDASAYHCIYSYDVHKNNSEILVRMATYKDQSTRNAFPESYIGPLSESEFSTPNFGNLAVWGPEFYAYLKGLDEFDGAIDA